MSFTFSLWQLGRGLIWTFEQEDCSLTGKDVGMGVDVQKGVTQTRQIQSDQPQVVRMVRVGRSPKNTNDRRYGYETGTQKRTEQKVL